MSNNKNSSGAFSTITDIYSNLGIDLSDLNSNLKYQKQQSEINMRSKLQEQYDTLNNFDDNTLNRMSSNTVETVETFETFDQRQHSQSNQHSQSSQPNQHTQSYLTNNIPHYSQFVQHRNPSLNTSLSPFPVQNMTVLPNQIHRSLDLLKQTDKLAISNFNANSDFNTLDKQFSQGITNPYGSVNTSDNGKAFISSNQFTQKQKQEQEQEQEAGRIKTNAEINYNPNEYNSNPYLHTDPIIDPNYEITGINNKQDKQYYMQRQIPTYDNFVPHREPALEVGLSALPIQNMTVLPNQIHRSLDLLRQSDQMNVSSFNKYSNYAETNPNIINSNDIEGIQIDKENFQGISQPFIPYPIHDKPTALQDNFANNGRMDLIKEYICHINSIDRDVKRYPNPFNFLVQCAPLAGNPDASISRTFENIRYIKIETGNLPRKYYIKKTQLDSSSNEPTIVALFSSSAPSDNSSVNGSNLSIIYSDFTSTTSHKRIINYTETKNDLSDNITITYEAVYTISTSQTITYKYEISSYTLDSDKYSILYLNDINDVSQFSTDQNLSQAFNVLYPDIISDYTVYVDCRYVDKIYKFSELGNMSRMLLRLTNSMGKDLTTNIKAQDSSVPNLSDTICTCTTDQFGNYQRNYKCICSYIRHPRYVKNQLDLMFKLGIVEIDFDKRPFN